MGNITETYRHAFCNNCQTTTPIETRIVVDDDGARTVTDYCKSCKKFNRTETDGSGRIVQQQADI